ncbi:SDR family NAD(P)-dependent oxidoreductase [Oceanimonas sp. CHS3-5]|uniref:SDR family NAD(P)-dependent oxidoreductase n=1 Tax=Oceanimonas sp. CHS3-5 TaxID=3068186 RepID=UPI00273F2907|nr:SDR family NAD(P)-dependent oxidoreductase [Oceanimonas sp. CHS3-5]MDP5292192.1 SDR family NAD(P)-dependent oxidoreductase [Oceanimonas sp. CHS3-5]
MDIKSKVVVITGAGRGLGRAMAHQLARQGAALALLDNNEQDLAKSGEMVASTGARVAVHLCDVADETQVADCFGHIVRELGGLDVLVNNAGLLRDALLVKLENGKVSRKMTLQDWQQVIDVNLTGSFLCGREAAAIMAERGEGGLIVNISSVARAGNAGQSNYAASKAGVAALVVCWAGELARLGIRVAGIAPGVIDTDMTARMKPEAMERITRRIPSGRLAEVDELVHSLQYIIENDYFNGRILEMDGGLRL